MKKRRKGIRADPGFLLDSIADAEKAIDIIEEESENRPDWWNNSHCTVRVFRSLEGVRFIARHLKAEDQMLQVC